MIKYYDNNKGCLYDANGQRVSNWDSNAEYADNEYVRVCFNIECPTYCSVCNGVTYAGFDNDEQREAFREEINNLLRGIGWEIPQNSCNATKSKENLYIHPQRIDGVVLTKNVKAIAELIEKHDTFYLRWVEIYEPVYDMDNDVYMEYLHTRKDDIKKLLLQACKTNRTCHFRYTYQIIKDICKKIYLNRIGCSESERGFIGSVTGVYIDNVINELAEQGYLIRKEYNGYDVVRTINKTEQKKLKLYID